jgi:hypothetical protein
MPPTTTTTNTIEPTAPGHRRLGDVGVAADHAGERGERGTAAEDEHEDPGHVVAEGLDRLRMGERRLDHQADAGAGEQQPDREQHQQREQHDERAGLRELGAEEREERPLQLRRQGIGHGGAAPDELHHLEDQVRQAEGDQQLGHVAELVHPAQAVALERGAEQATRSGAISSAGQKPIATEIV